MTGSSTSSLRHHIKTKHPRDWARVIEAEKAKAELEAANKAEAKKLQEDMEGDPEEEEEDLTPGTPAAPTSPTPGPSRKRSADDVLPLLGDIARKYLCVPASSASSERLFSASGNVVTKLRSSLDPQNLELLVYLHENVR